MEHLNWMLAPGERIGLVGVNGSGKTTLLRTLAGDYPLAAGKRVHCLLYTSELPTIYSV